MEPFLGSIMVASFGFPPKGWALCNGQLMTISQNQALFSLLGTNFGGDGRTTFGLPNLQGRAALGMGNGNTVGQSGGEATHTLTSQEMPAHNHGWQATASGPSTNAPDNGVLAGAGMYTNSPNQAMAQGEISNFGGSQPHENRSPFLVLNFCIALIGIFPSRN